MVEDLDDEIRPGRKTGLSAGEDAHSGVESAACPLIITAARPAGNPICDS
jgi:hypothetical protein